MGIPTLTNKRVAWELRRLDVFYEPDRDGRSVYVAPKGWRYEEINPGDWHWDDVFKCFRRIRRRGKKP